MVVELNDPVTNAIVWLVVAMGWLLPLPALGSESSMGDANLGQRYTSCLECQADSLLALLLQSSP
jgi:hypothetical protein